MTDKNYEKAKSIKRDIFILKDIKISHDVSERTFEWFKKTMLDKISELEKEFEDL